MGFRLLIVLAFFLSGCGDDPLALDASSPDALRNSLSEIEEDGTEEERANVAVGLQVAMMERQYGGDVVVSRQEFAEMALEGGTFFPGTTRMSAQEYVSLLDNLVLRMGTDIDGMTPADFEARIEAAGERLAARMAEDRQTEIEGLRAYLAEAEGADGAEVAAAQRRRRERAAELEGRAAARTAAGESMISNVRLADVTVNARARDLRVVPALTFVNELEVPATNVFVEMVLTDGEGEPIARPQRTVIKLPRGTRSLAPGDTIDLVRETAQPVQLIVPKGKTTSEVFEDLPGDVTGYGVSARLVGVTTTGPDRKDWQADDREEAQALTSVQAEANACEEARERLAAARRSAETRLDLLEGTKAEGVEPRQAPSLAAGVLRSCLVSRAVEL